MNETFEQMESGEVVVTTDETGRAVAVTRQDNEGQILGAIWEAKAIPTKQEPMDWSNEPIQYQTCCVDGTIFNNEVVMPNHAVKWRVTSPHTPIDRVQAGEASPATTG